MPGGADFPDVDAIGRLITLLDDNATEIADHAKAGLMCIGGPAVPPLVAAVPRLHRYGKLAAIEILTQLKDRRATDALIRLLADEDSTVREWSAIALAELRIRAAVPALRSAYDKLRALGAGPEGTEAVALRSALTSLGGRREVLPALSRSLRHTSGRLDQLWPSERLADVVEDLAAHRQAVLFFALWRITEHELLWCDHAAPDLRVDRATPWAEVVAATREATLAEVANADLGDDVFASIEWIDESDR